MTRHTLHGILLLTLSLIPSLALAGSGEDGPARGDKIEVGGQPAIIAPAIASGVVSAFSVVALTVKDSDNQPDLTNEVTRPWGAAHAVSIPVGHALLPILSLIPLFRDVGGKGKDGPTRPDDVIDPGLSSALLGPSGVRSVWGPRRALSSDYGLSTANFSGKFYANKRWGADSSPATPGIQVSGDMRGFQTRFHTRFRALRLSLGYSNYVAHLLTQREKNMLAPQPFPMEEVGAQALFSETQSFISLDFAYGVQLFQGLFSPYIQHRMRRSFILHRAGWVPAEAVDSYSDDDDLDQVVMGGWELPVAHDVTLGNTFDISGIVATRTRQRHRFILDVRTHRPLRGTLHPEFEASFGYTLAWY